MTTITATRPEVAKLNNEESRHKLSGTMSLCTIDSKDLVEEIESPKKLYQSIQETVRQLDVSSSKCMKVEDLFSSDLLAKRHQIKELCEKLISQHSPKTYGSFAREKLWRHVFYDAFVRARKLQRDKPWTPLQLAYIKSHLLNGIGQIHLFTLKIQECSDYLKIPLLMHPSSFEGIMYEDMTLIRKSRAVTEDERREQKWLVELVHMCLINIGDLYRYMNDIYSKVTDSFEDSSVYFDRAQEWYSQAFLLYPAAGLSLNQLGNIYSEFNWGIDSAYYLLYSTITENAYEGAYPNLRQLLDRKLVQFARLPASTEPKPMEVLCHGFLSMLYHMLCEESHLPNYEKVCQETLANFHERLVTYDPNLDEKLLFKFSAMSVMIVWRLQSINSKNTSPAVAFAMSIFFQLVYQLGVILEEHSHLERPISCLPSCEEIEENLKETSATTHLNEKNEDSKRLTDCKSVVKDKTKQRKKMGMERGRRYRASSIPSLHSYESEESEPEREGLSDEDSENEEWESDYSEVSSSEVEDEEEEEEFENESVPEVESEDCLDGVNNGKAFDTSSSNGRSETSGSGAHSQKSMDGLRQELGVEDREGTPNHDEDTVATEEKQERLTLKWEDLLKCQSQLEPLLVALTPFIRWLQICPAIKDALAANAEKIFLEKLCGILTLLSTQNWVNNLDGDPIQQQLSQDWNMMMTTVGSGDKVNLFNYQLPEDRSMLGLPLLQEFMSGLQIQEDLTKSDEMIIRIGRLVTFGSWMNNTGSFSMMYSDDDKRFFVPTPQMLKDHIRTTKMKRLFQGKEEPESLTRLTRAYRDMKIRDRGVRRGRRYADRDYDDPKEEKRRRRRRDRNEKPTNRVKPIYIVIDLEAALNKMENVKRLACNKNFVVCVPNSVWESLDMLKDTDQKGSDESREAFRWIESAMRRSHPGIRTLKANEKERLRLEYPEDPSEIETWEYLEMLECCNFLIQSEFKGKHHGHDASVFGDYRDKYCVFYLSGNDELLDNSMKREFDPIKIARSVGGAYVDCISMYPPRRIPRKGRKWQTSGKCKG